MAEPWPDIAGRLDGTSHVLPVRVYFEDTDFSGLVYHASFLRFCERGRSDFLRLAGIGHSTLLAGEGTEESVFFAVRRIEADYLAPARIDDLLTVHSNFRSLGRARLEIDQEVRRGETVLAHVVVTVVVLGGDSRPRRFPAALRNVLQPLVDR